MADITFTIGITTEIDGNISDGLTDEVLEYFQKLLATPKQIEISNDLILIIKSISAKATQVRQTLIMPPIN